MSMKIAFALTLLAGLAGSAAAESTVAYRLDYQADAACAGADRFGAEVAARVGYVPWTDAVAPALTVRIGADAGGFLGELSTGGAPKQLRSVDCDTLVDALASATAVLLDQGPLVLEVRGAGPGSIAFLPPMPPRIERRWKPFVPWAITAAGTAVAMLGGASMIIARANMDVFNNTITTECNAGCSSTDIENDPELSAAYDTKDRASWQNDIGVGLLAVGGAALVTGLVMVALNQPVIVDGPRLTVGAGPGTVGLSLGGSL